MWIQLKAAINGYLEKKCLAAEEFDDLKARSECILKQQYDFLCIVTTNDSPVNT
jgi:hypothetical protein